MSRQPSQQSVEWTAIVTADREYYKRVIARGGPDTVEFPELFPERRIRLRDNTLIGRANRKQGVEPGIDLGIHPIDRGVSTQHAVLRIRDSGLTITDLGSTNGTSLNDSDDLLGNGEEIAGRRRRPHSRRRVDHDHRRQVRVGIREHTGHRAHDRPEHGSRTP